MTPRSIVKLEEKTSEKAPVSLENQTRSTPMRRLNGLPDRLR